MRLIAFPQWDKLTFLLRGMARQSATDFTLSCMGEPLWDLRKVVILGAVIGSYSHIKPRRNW